MQAVLCSSEQSAEQFVTPTNEPKIAPPRESFATLLFAGELNPSRRHRGANITGFRRVDGSLNLLSQRSHKAGRRRSEGFAVGYRADCRRPSGGLGMPPATGQPCLAVSRLQYFRLGRSRAEAGVGWTMTALSRKPTSSRGRAMVGVRSRRDLPGSIAWLRQPGGRSVAIDLQPGHPQTGDAVRLDRALPREKLFNR